MRKFSIMALAALACATPVLAGGPSAAIARGEARLASELKGRTAGTPVSCINHRDIRSAEIIDRTAILYRTYNNKVYVNRPDFGAQSLYSGNVIVNVQRGTQLCNVDTVQMYDSMVRMQTGSVGLGLFVPYEKPRAS